jgi:hypothetical protein
MTLITAKYRACVFLVCLFTVVIGCTSTDEGDLDDVIRPTESVEVTNPKADESYDCVDVSHADSMECGVGFTVSSDGCQDGQVHCVVVSTCRPVSQKVTCKPGEDLSTEGCPEGHHHCIKY